MSQIEGSMSTENSLHNDLFYLSRFISAQEPAYTQVLLELKDGQRRSNWMWYIFPHISELIYSKTSAFYSLKSQEEAQAYLAHPVLGERLRECAEAVLAIKGASAFGIFGSPNDFRLYASMTLFAGIAGPDSVFAQVLKKCFDGELKKDHWCGSSISTGS